MIYYYIMHICNQYIETNMYFGIGQGAALAQAILENLVDVGTTRVIVTTHYQRIKVHTSTISSYYYLLLPLTYLLTTTTIQILQIGAGSNGCEVQNSGHGVRR